MEYKEDGLWLMRGDCLEEMKKIPDGSVDLVLTDPPYGTTACKWDTIIDLEKMWGEIQRITKIDSVVVMTSSQPFTTTLISSNINNFKYCWQWEKSRPSNINTAKYQPLRYTEDICVFYKKFRTYNPIMWEGKKNNNNSGKSYSNITDYERQGTGNTSSLKYPRNIISVNSIGPNSSLHPTQKPVKLMEYLVKTYTNEGDTVLDFTVGSGTTGVACKKLNRNFIGIELDEGYFKIAKERILNT